METNHEKAYNYVYQITNLKNNMLYVGVHSTNNLEDGYMGSSKPLKADIKLLGKNNFKKTILKNFSTQQKAYTYEAEIVNKQFVLREDTYNQQEGGKGGSVGQLTVTDKEGNSFKVYTDDPKWLSGEYDHPIKNRTNVFDHEGNIISISIFDPRFLNGELISIHRGVSLSKETRKKISISSIGRKVSKETVNKIQSTKLKNGTNKHSYETKKKMSNAQTGRVHTQEENEAQSLRIQGKNNPFYGNHHTEANKRKMAINKDTITIHKDGKNKRVAHLDLEFYLEKGYSKGMIKKSNKNSKWIHKGEDSKMVFEEDLLFYFDKGWTRGRGKLIKK